MVADEGLARDGLELVASLEVVLDDLRQRLEHLLSALVVIRHEHDVAVFRIGKRFALRQDIGRLFQQIHCLPIDFFRRRLFQDADRVDVSHNHQVRRALLQRRHHVDRIPEM